jgi:hypothetical protein
MKHSESISPLVDKAKKDLESIFQQLNSGRFVRNKSFSDDVNNHLKETIELDKKSKTKTVIRLSSRNEPKIKKPFLSSGKTKVIISGTGDSYWIVDGKESAIPGEVEKSRIRKDTKAEYQLMYQKDENNQYILIDFVDDNGYQLGASRIRTESREIPSIFHGFLSKKHYKISFLVGFLYTFILFWDSSQRALHSPGQWFTLLTIVSLIGGVGYLNFIAVDVLRVILKREFILYLAFFVIWTFLFFSIADPLEFLTFPLILVVGKTFIR